MNICGFFFFFFFLGGGGHYEIGLLFISFFLRGEGVISIHFKSFLRSRYRMGIFFGPQNFKYFWVCLIFLIFLFGGGGGLNSRCWVQAYV